MMTIKNAETGFVPAILILWLEVLMREIFEEVAGKFRQEQTFKRLNWKSKQCESNNVCLKND